MRQLAGDGRRNHGSDTGHGRVQSDHARRNAATLEDEAQERQSEADGDAHGADGRYGGNKRWPVDIVGVAVGM